MANKTALEILHEIKQKARACEEADSEQCSCCSEYEAMINKLIEEAIKKHGEIHHASSDPDNIETSIDQEEKDDSSDFLKS